MAHQDEWGIRNELISGGFLLIWAHMASDGTLWCAARSLNCEVLANFPLKQGACIRLRGIVKLLPNFVRNAFKH